MVVVELVVEVVDLDGAAAVELGGDGDELLLLLRAFFLFL